MRRCLEQGEMFKLLSRWGIPESGCPICMVQNVIDIDHCDFLDCDVSRIKTKGYGFYGIGTDLAI